MEWWLQEVRKARCPHQFKVTAFDARILDRAGNQYELEQCPHCLTFRNGALVKHGPKARGDASAS